MANICKLQCRNEFNIWIGAEFDWEDMEQLDSTIDLESDTHGAKPQILGELTIKLTLTKRRGRQFRSGFLEQAQINESCLTEDAFQPKVYSARLEKGIFTTPSDAKAKIDIEPTENFALRLVFDHSPYPARPEWKEPEGGPDANEFWYCKTFVARELPRDQKKAGRPAQEGSKCVMC